ncbi:MAG TPA: ABC transporter permease, partial [Kofleriaceae bacterium]|nr:ABC transporter permease [Kofleriaceae bacterium]
ALSVAWGIFMLVILLGAGNGLENSVEEKFADDAVNSIWVFAGKTSKPHEGMPIGRPIQLTLDDYQAIRRVPGVEHITARFYLRGGEYAVSYGDKHSAFEIRSVHPDHLYLEKTLMTSGRFLNDFDIAERTKVAVIGAEVQKFLFPPGVEPLGKYIHIGGIAYQVVGVFEDVGGEAELRKVYIPITTAQAAYGGGDHIDQVMFTLSGSLADAKRIEQSVLSLLSARHRFAADDRRAVRFRNNVENFAEVQQIFQFIRIFLWIVGIGTIIAGIVGVSNIMLISVKERTREIGLRKAVGATPWSLVALIVQEAVLLTGVAGYLGLVAGVLSLELVTRLMPKNDYIAHPEVDLGVALGATVLLVVFGALAGYFPARRASRVNPIVALREE